MTRSEAVANLKRMGLLVDALRIKAPNCPNTIKAVRDHAVLLDMFCPSCVFRIDLSDPDDYVFAANGKRYHSGCEPYTR